MHRLPNALKLLPMLSLLTFLLTALLMMSTATENSVRFSRLYSSLLLLSTIGLLILSVLIGRSLYDLLSQYRARTPGSRLTLRLMVLFVMIALAPVTVLYYFSLQFLQKSIDSWFDVRVESALEDALELSRTTLDLKMREILKQTVSMAENLINVKDNSAALMLGKMLTDSGAIELTLFNPSGHIIATASADISAVVPNRPSEIILLQVRQGRNYVSLDPIYNVGFYIRAVVKAPVLASPREGFILQALFPMTGRISQLADSVQSAFDKYKELVFMRTPLKMSFILTLSLVLLLGILSAVWTAVYAARRLVKPIRDLAEGTQAVAAGQYDKQLLQSSNDELGFLVSSFNQMTRKLAQARDAALRSQHLLERQRAYLEAVLSRLSSGVLTLDSEGRLRAYNTAAIHILGMDLSNLVGVARVSNDTEYNPFQHVLAAIAEHLTGTTEDWRQEVILFGSAGRKVLMCRGSSLPDPLGPSKGGHVIVFDDITALVQAERDAAWTEVARRLAHEIKNPLTPIQLAAERIRHKYLKNLSEEEARVLERGTHTIIQQVHAMKEMVDAFNQYARAPRLNLEKVSLNDFITEVLYLYRDYPAGVEMQLNLDPRQPVIEADKGRLRQLLHNIVKNTIEAIRDGQGSTLKISTHCDRQTDIDHVELSFHDDGPGFPHANIGNIFEPYVTTKPKGTGLGLAIVKKIVEEHGGLIFAENPSEGGARIVIRFPLRYAIVRSASTTINPMTLSSEETG
jgi:nitrogen fixation/metabolism regulation signal transduction histidine kinase